MMKQKINLSVITLCLVISWGCDSAQRSMIELDEGAGDATAGDATAGEGREGSGEVIEAGVENAGDTPPLIPETDPP